MNAFQHYANLNNVCTTFNIDKNKVDQKWT